MAAGAQQYVPDTTSLDLLATAALGCRGCDLYRDAEQTVFGAGPPAAAMMMVGEQPGDVEDRAGQPFVGPAGRLLDRALAEAGIDRDAVYLTNAVKHFRFTRAVGSTRRIHKSPSRTEIVACRPWLFAEIAAVRPEVLVLMGATAAQSLLGNGFRVTAHRGERLELPADPDRAPGAPAVAVTAHPSSVLRTKGDGRADAFEALVGDLRFAAGLSRRC